MERSRPELVLGYRVGAVLDEELCDIEMTTPRRCDAKTVELRVQVSTCGFAA
jgi:hypothetical protein